MPQRPSVRTFIRIHADQARLDSVDVAIKLLGRDALGVREVAVEERGGKVPKRPALEDHPVCVAVGGGSGGC